MALTSRLTVCLGFVKPGGRDVEKGLINHGKVFQLFMPFAPVA